MIAIGTRISDIPLEEAHLLAGCIVSLEGTSWAIVATEDPPPAWVGKCTILLQPVFLDRCREVLKEKHPKFGPVRRIGNESPTARACFILTVSARLSIERDPLARFLHI